MNSTSADRLLHHVTTLSIQKIIQGPAITSTPLLHHHRITTTSYRLSQLLDIDLAHRHDNTPSIQILQGLTTITTPHQQLTSMVMLDRTIPSCLHVRFPPTMMIRDHSRMSRAMSILIHQPRASQETKGATLLHRQTQDVAKIHSTL